MNNNNITNNTLTSALSQQLTLLETADNHFLSGLTKAINYNVYNNY